MKYVYTCSGGAATNTEAATDSAAIAVIGFDRVFEALEALRPHLLEKLPDGLEAFGPECIQSPLADRAHRDQPRVLEDPEVLRDGLLGHVEVGGDLAYRMRLVAYQHQDGPTTGLRQRSQGSLSHHPRRISKLWLVQVALCDRFAIATSRDLYKRWPTYRQSNQEDLMTTADPLSIARRYHEGWTSNNYEQSTELLAPTATFEVPINSYPTAESFAQALRGFGKLVSSVTMLSEMSAGDEAMLLYDLQVDGLGELRVVEHFTIANGQIERLRQIHDTTAVRAAGLGT